ncbi:hypothetical protein CXB51_012048 [Gossypium anomalum]|uniref:Uncharacterized protein n=1 Tax=Gossypium anomalum TaxID=47600 RepID=A0A8J5Z688_9ROSI|nr:hypothetical protein CXB51_012048 [Gossypium anomalum]
MHVNNRCYIYWLAPLILRVAMLVIFLWFCSDGVPQNSILCYISPAFVILMMKRKRMMNRVLSSIADSRICYPFRLIHVGNRQKIVILVKFPILVFLFMTTFSVLIWIGMEDNPIESSMMSRVYVDLFAAAQLLLGGALAYYGLLLICQKMRTVRSERASSEIWKVYYHIILHAFVPLSIVLSFWAVAGLATLSVLCFTSSSFVPLFTNIPICFITGMYRTYMVFILLKSTVTRAGLPQQAHRFRYQEVVLYDCWFIQEHLCAMWT